MFTLADIASPFIQVAFVAGPIIAVAVLVALAVWGSIALIKKQKKKKALEDYFSNKDEENRTESD